MTDTQNDTSELREAVKRFCRTDEATDNLVRFIAQREQAAELRGRIDENRRAGAVWGGLVSVERVHHGMVYMNEREVALRQATKPEKEG